MRAGRGTNENHTPDLSEKLINRLSGSHLAIIAMTALAAGLQSEFGQQVVNKILFEQGRLARLRHFPK